MYCEHCGNKIDGSHKFCTKCGSSVFQVVKRGGPIQETSVVANEKWWQRLLKVAYIVLYLPLLLIIPIVWAANASSYNYSSSSYTDTSGTAFWYCLLTLLIYMVIARLIKIAVVYIAAGRRPEWKKEFRKFF
jgi:hypothetical protein